MVTSGSPTPYPMDGISRSGPMYLVSSVMYDWQNLLREWKICGINAVLLSANGSAENINERVQELHMYDELSSGYFLSQQARLQRNHLRQPTVSLNSEQHQQQYLWISASLLLWGLKSAPPTAAPRLQPVRAFENTVSIPSAWSIATSHRRTVQRTATKQFRFSDDIVLSPNKVPSIWHVNS